MQQSHNKRKEYEVQIQNKRSLYYCRFNSNTVSFNIKVITESTVGLSKTSMKKSNKKRKDTHNTKNQACSLISKTTKP